MAQLDVMIFLISTVIMALKPLLLHLTGESIRSEVALPPAFFQLSVEALKAAVCSLALLSRRGLGMSAAVWSGWWHTVAQYIRFWVKTSESRLLKASFALPAAVYLLMNVLTVAAARMLHPPMLQLVASIKILFTAVASRMLMSKKLHTSQWLALLLLTAGVAIGGRGNGTSEDGRELPQAPLLGIVLMLINCMLSSLGGVCTEMALKHRSSAELTIFATNLHMALHSLLLNGSALLLVPGEERPHPEFLRASDALALGNEALNGILISLLMRRIDAIAKNYVFSVSIFTTAGMTAMILRHWPSWQFYLGASICAMSMAIYAQAQEKAKAQ